MRGNSAQATGADRCPLGGRVRSKPMPCSWCACPTETLRRLAHTHTHTSASTTPQSGLDRKWV